MPSLASTLYRSLLRQARVHDQRPALKAYLTHQKQRPNATSSGSAERDIRDVYWDKFLTNGVFYVPGVSMTDLVRKGFRCNDNYSVQEKQQLAFYALKVLNNNISVCRQLGLDRSNPDLPTKLKVDLSLVQRPPAKAGSILISHPSQQSKHFRQTVILMSQVTDGEKDPVGLITNIQLPGTVRHHEHLRTWGSEFFECPVYWGGPHQVKGVSVLHPYGHLRDSTKIMEGVYLHADFDHTKHEIQNGAVDPRLLRFYINCTRWSPGCSSRHCLSWQMRDHLWFTVCNPIREVCGLEIQRSPAAVSSSFEANQKRSGVWHRALTSLGGEFQDFGVYSELTDSEQEQVHFVQ